jgi:hypothetical protein
LLKDVWNGWKELTRAMGGFQSRILLGLFYFIIVMPFGILVRAFGDPLELRHRARPSTRRLAQIPTEVSVEAARRQS